jgi:hypothetical protein
MYRPELDGDQKQLIYAAFAASIYPKGLDYGTVQSDGSPSSDDECEGEYGERWISVPAGAHATSHAAGRKKRTRKGKKNKNESITFVRVQDFFTRTPYVQTCIVATSPANCLSPSLVPHALYRARGIWMRQISLAISFRVQGSTSTAV